VTESDTTVAFLDHRPLFPGHTLVIPRLHIETLRDLPPTDVGPFFAEVQRLAVAVQDTHIEPAFRIHDLFNREGQTPENLFCFKRRGDRGLRRRRLVERYR